ncbi:putative retroelement protein [Cucumis melo var. makuwa]|uniref:Retroelement protein n=1 Tax=Cucumis melo var. makuwa TaxID=1194695 RepID=A0A5A7VI47_CUCMM|nr:putative retroelement protein [Cucumis melo var. makuwa]TYK26271.1 putative retroelement protein [Cucumis melo var. makuwa]
MSMKIMNGSQPEEVLDYQKNKAGQWEILISWEGLPRHEATWEAYDEMQRLYPDLRLEDKHTEIPPGATSQIFSEATESKIST